MDVGTRDESRANSDVRNVGCPFRVDTPQGKILCFDPQAWSAQPPPEEILEEYCLKDPQGCPLCKAALDGLREMLLRHYG